MPFTYFFATQADLAPGLAALQRERPLQFVRCRRGGWLDSAVIPTYTSLLEATDLDHLQFRSYPGRDHIDRLDLTTFFVLDAATPVYVEEHLVGSALPDGGTIHYRVALPENDPMVHLTPGGLQPSARVLWSGEHEDAGPVPPEC